MALVLARASLRQIDIVELDSQLVVNFSNVTLLLRTGRKPVVMLKWSKISNLFLIESNPMEGSGVWLEHCAGTVRAYIKLKQLIFSFCIH